MSHAVVICILPHGTRINPRETDLLAAVNPLVSDLMAPFNENDEWGREGSKWDWWVIGGRWTGLLTDYEPSKDPRNMEVCNICNGTGTRSMPVPYDSTWLPKIGECNGCHGKGYRLRLRLVPYQGDVQLVRNIPKKTTAFALLSTETGWKESGKLGMFGSKAVDWQDKVAWMRHILPKSQQFRFWRLLNSIDNKLWHRTFHKLIGKFDGDRIAVVVDYHV
jgi:hypothetical protein